MSTNDEQRAALTALAQHMREGHRNTPSSRELSQHYEECGIAGEWAFAKEFAQPFDYAKRRFKGDGGIDFYIPLMFSVDVKCRYHPLRNPDRMLVEQGTVKADLYVLAGYDGDILNGECVGWCDRSLVFKYEPRDTGKGIINHPVPRSALRPMIELKAMLAVTGYYVEPRK